MFTLKFNWCLLRTVVIVIGEQFSIFNCLVYAGLINDANAPVSIGNQIGSPNVDEIFMLSRQVPCLLISRYSCDSCGHWIQNFLLFPCNCSYLVSSLEWYLH